MSSGRVQGSDCSTVPRNTPLAVTADVSAQTSTQSQREFVSQGNSDALSGLHSRHTTGRDSGYPFPLDDVSGISAFPSLESHQTATIAS